MSIAIDRTLSFEILGWMDADGARALLTTIASSMIGVSATVFSITIAAVAYASGNYGPRLLTNFMQDKGNQISLGTFLATFVYSVMILRVVDEQFVPNISLFIATVLLGISVAVLVFFLHHIPASIRINSVLRGIGEHLIQDIKNRFPSEKSCSEPNPQTEGGEPLVVAGVGYVNIIDFASLNEISESNDLTVILKIRTGDFVHRGLPVANIIGDAEPDTVKKIESFFSVGSRSRTQDIEYLIDELVEIALRALSPGINDPFTAISAMMWLTAAMAELARRDLRRGPEQDGYVFTNVQPLPDDFEHFMGRGFGELRTSAATSPMACMKFFDCLDSIARECIGNEFRLAVVSRERNEMIKQARMEMRGPDAERVERKYSNV